MKNNELTSEQRQALDHARHLAEHGVPLFIGKPAPDDYKGKTAAGFILPKDWQKTKPSAAVADRWKPGMALCAVMGHVVDGLDVDTQKGGDDSLDGVARPRSYGRQRTPSGGTHDLIAPLGVRSRNDLRKGVDVKAGVEGDGIGFLFLAPTEKKSKTTGEVEAYRWETPPDLTALDNRDTSGDEIGALFYPSQPAPAIAAPYDGPAYKDLPDHLQKMADAEGDRRVEMWHRIMENALDWQEGKADSAGRSWEGLARDAAWSFACLASFPWSGLDVKGAVELFNRSLPEDFAATEECPEKRPDQKLVNKAAERVPVEPPPWDGLAPAGGSKGDFSGGGGKGNSATALPVQLRDHVDAHYDVFPADDDGRVYLQRKHGGRAELLSRNAVIRAADGLGSGYATLSSAASEAAAVLGANAQNRLKVRPRPLALRVHHDRRQNRIILDLGRSWSARCVVVTADGWSIEDAPPPGVSFLLPGRALPEPERGGDLEELRDHLRWEAHDPRWPLIKGWLPGALLANVPRPTLGLFGPQGSAKTTTGRFVASLLDPKPPGALGGGLGKNLKDDETKALKSYIPAWDNVSHLSGEAADFLSRMGTGENAERRQLYSDTEMVSVFYRRTSIITGITVPSGIKPDTLDRMLIVNFERLVGERISEGRLEDEWERVQPRALAGVLDLAVEMLKGLPSAKNPENLRMGDYAEALWAIDPALYDAYAAAYGSAKTDMAENDPFVSTILHWLQDRKDHTFEGTPEQAFRAASAFSNVHEFDGYWPDSSRSFGRQVSRAEELLPAVGVTLTRRKSNGVRLLRFELSEGVTQ